MSDPEDRKEALRRAFRDRREALGPDDVLTASERLCARLADDDELGQASSIGGFASVRREIDIFPYLRARLERDARVFLPRVTGPGEMVFVEVDDLDGLERGAFGIPEPVGPAADPSEIVHFLLPGLAFDSRGGRLGMGGGYYDRFLGALLGTPLASPLANQSDRGEAGRERDVRRPRLIGACYSWQVVDDPLPMEPHDVRLDRVVTDREILSVDAATSVESTPYKNQ
jgi:5-formyltetrahydrofolate cyclo-ligase